MKNNDWKDRLGVMYSTNPDFQYNTGNEVEEDICHQDWQPDFSLWGNYRGCPLTTHVHH